MSQPDHDDTRAFLTVEEARLDCLRSHRKPRIVIARRSLDRYAGRQRL